MSGAPGTTGDPDIDRLLGSLSKNRASADEDPDIARLMQSLQKGKELDTSTPTAEELNVAEQPTFADPAPVVTPRVAPRFDLKADLEQTMRASGSPEDVQVDPAKTPSAKLSFLVGRARSFNEVRDKFYKQFPEGTVMKQIDSAGNEHIVYRENKEDKTWGVIGEDTPGMAGRIPWLQVGGAIATSVATGGWGLLPRMLAQGAVGIATEGADIALEPAFGYDRKMRPGEVTQALGWAGAGGAGGEALPSVLSTGTKAVNLIRGAVKPERLGGGLAYGKGYAEAAAEEGLIPPMVGQAFSDPRARGLFRQVAGGTLPIREVKGKQILDLQAKLDKKANEEGFQAMSGNELEAYSKLKEAQIKDELLQGTKFKGEGLDPTATAEAADRRVKEKLAQWAGAETAAITNIYTGGKATSGIRFNLQRVKETAESLPTYIMGDDGTPIKIGGPDGKLGKIVSDLEGAANVMVPTASGDQVKNAVQQIVLIRTKLHEIAQSAAEGSETKKHATALLESVKDMMANPIGAKGWGPTIQKRVTDALDRYQKYEDQITILRGYMKGNADGMADRFFQPDKFEALKTLKEVAPEDFEFASNAFINKMFANPDQVIKTLDSFTKNNRESTLRLFMSKRDEDAWRTFATNMENYGKAKYNVLRSADTTALENAQSYVFGTGKPGAVGDKISVQRGELEDFIKGQAGGKDSARANELRAGIYHKILNDSMGSSKEGVEGGAYELQPGKIVKWIDELKANQTNLNALMRPQDWRTLDNFRKYAVMLEETATGAQLQQQSDIAKISQFGHAFSNPQHYAMVIAKFVNQGQLARILSKPVSSDMLIQAIETGGTAESMKHFRAATALALQQSFRDNKVEKEE